MPIRVVHINGKFINFHYELEGVLVLDKIEDCIRRACSSFTARNRLGETGGYTFIGTGYRLHVARPSAFCSFVVQVPSDVILQIRSTQAY